MTYQECLEKLEKGQLRSAQKDAQGIWQANIDVKNKILEAFRQGKMVEGQGPYQGYFDKDTLMPRPFSLEQNIRNVPHGTAVRRGSYIASGVVIMPPSFINVGAYVDEGTMVDSHCLVGSCAQIGKRVHLSTGVQIGGVLEPVGLNPVVIEDDCFIGANAVIVEGIVVRSRAVIAPGVILSKGTPVFDTVYERELPRGSAIPEGAVVVPGSRPFKDAHSWAYHQNLNLQCAIIIKYRDAKSDAALTLEEALR